VVDEKVVADNKDTLFFYLVAILLFYLNELWNGSLMLHLSKDISYQKRNPFFLELFNNPKDSVQGCLLRLLMSLPVILSIFF